MLNSLLEEKPKETRRETVRISMAGCRCLVFSQDAPLAIIQTINVTSKANKYIEFISGKAKEEIKGRMNIRVSNKGSIMI
jgi:homoaconitase/3-isopropylmalate dehydratase large subunit